MRICILADSFRIPRVLRKKEVNLIKFQLKNVAVARSSTSKTAATHTARQRCALLLSELHVHRTMQFN